MPSPFPGMDPYLEEPALWPGVHASLLTPLRDQLVALLRPRYVVIVELRTYEERLDKLELIAIGDVDVAREHLPLTGTNGHEPARAPGATRESEGQTGTAHHARAPRVLAVQVPPLVEVRERYLEIRRVRSHDVVTTIEILSPTNKRGGAGRDLYERKRQQIITTQTSLVEIDLLRAGTPLPVLHKGMPLDRSQMGDYRVLVSRGHQGHRADLYLIDLGEPLPSIPIPLAPGDDEPVIDLQTMLGQVYDRGGFDLLVDYAQPPIPRLAAEDEAWADALLRERGLR